jgi:hypothetical protein
MPMRCMFNFFDRGCCRWLTMSLGHFLFGFHEDGIVSCLMVNVPFMEHRVETLVLNLAPTAASI